MSKGFLFPTGDENVAKSRPYVVYTLIAVNIIVFIISLLNFKEIINNYGFIPAQVSILALFTSMFLHGGIAHVFGNMWFLWIFGDNVEDKWGHITFIFIYLGSGIFAAFVHWLSNPASLIPTIGASGAISGVLGSYMVMFPNVKVHVTGPGFSRFPLSAIAMIGFWFIMQLALGTIGLFGDTGSGIAFWAHVGGFIFGAAVTFVAMKLGFIKLK